MAQETEHDYFKVDRVSNSLLSAFYRKLQGLPPLRGSHHLHFGSGFHCVLLEARKFVRSDYTGSDLARINGMVRQCRELLPEEIWNGQKEHEVYWSMDGAYCKAKIDLIWDRIMADFKTTGATDPQKFLEMAVEFGYPRQGAFYLDTPLAKRRGIDTFIIYGVSKVKPYTIFPYQLHRNDPLIQAGREEYKFLMRELLKQPQYKHLNKPSYLTSLAA